MIKPFVVVLVATESEFHAARELLDTGYLEYSFFGHQSLLVDLNNIFLVIQILPRMGNIDAAIGTTEVIRHYRPICVVGAGICAGVQTRKNTPTYCDVVVADKVVYYEPAKRTPSGIEWRPRDIDCTVSADLLDRIRAPERIPSLPHNRAAKTSPSPSPKVHRGLYASGEKVVADEKSLLELRLNVYEDFEKDVAAIEMEAAGIAAACVSSGTKFLIAKAIADFGTADKNDQWQSKAALASLCSVIEWARSLTQDDIGALRLRDDLSLGEDRCVRATQVANYCGHMLPYGGVSDDRVRARAVDDLITDYDEVVEKFATKELGQHFKYALIGEEFVEQDESHLALTGQACWIVDPVDGTQNLVGGRPEVAVSIALYEGGTAKIGIVHLPYRGMTIRVVKDKKLEVNGVPWTRRAPAKTLEGAVVALPGDMRRVKGSELENVFESIIPKAGSVRITGALAYDLACVALGEFDARISTSAKLVDVAAGALLIRETGGKVTDIEGKDWTPGTSTTIIAAASPELHREILNVIRTGRRQRKSVSAK